MASALAFHVFQCLFCFYFYFVTWETPGNGLCWSQLRSPEAVWTLSPRQQSSALCCTSTAAAWSSAELKDNRGGSSPLLHAPSFSQTACSVVQFWWERCWRGMGDWAVWAQPKGWVFCWFSPRVLPTASFWLASTKAGTAHPGHFGQGSIKD